MSQQILLVEDDEDISTMIHNHLTQEQYKVTCAYDGEEALKLAGEIAFQLVILDLLLPKLEGMECLRRIRQSSLIPVLILSAKGSDLDKALGLGFGADDYLAKPFSMTELVARVKALIRRASYASTPPMESMVIHDLEILPRSYSVRKQGNDIQLTMKEFQILHLLATNQARIFTKEEIYQRVWGETYMGDANAINVHISRLRDKLEDIPSAPRHITTVWGIGYRWGE